jgi:hypothetical protein
MEGSSFVCVIWIPAIVKSSISQLGTWDVMFTLNMEMYEADSYVKMLA